MRRVASITVSEFRQIERNAERADLEVLGGLGNGARSESHSTGTNLLVKNAG
jgi:hypothetical protein